MSIAKKLGALTALICQLVALALVLFVALLPTSPVQFTISAWLMAGFTSLALLCSIGLFFAKTSWPVVINLITTISAGFLSILLGGYWILLLLLLALIGCVVYRAG